MTKGTYPDKYISMPDIFFTDFVWTTEEADKWLSSPHSERLDLLSARGGSLHTSSLVVPITVCWEDKDSANILFHQGMAPVMLYWNSPGAVYMGLHSDISQHATYSRGDETLREVWNASKADIAHLQMRSGKQVVQEMLALYHSRLPGVLCAYDSIVRKSIEAHREWVANGGYTIASDPSLGPSVETAADRVRAQQSGETAIGPERLEAESNNEPCVERAEFEDWPESVKRALDDFTNAANAGISAVTKFTIFNANWQGLSVEQKGHILKIWELENETSTLTDNMDRGVVTGPTDYASGSAKVAERTVDENVD